MNGTQTTGEPSTKAWAVFPCHWIRDGKCSCGKADCSSPGKHPLTSRGFSDATADAEQLAKWWKVNPNANVGLATGELNGILVIDIDPQHGGSESLLEIEETYGHLPETVEVITGGNGLHLYYRYPEGVEVSSRNGWMPGIDVKANGGYVIAPPSNHISGRRYEWAESFGPSEIELAHVPPWLLELLPRKPKPKPAPSVNGNANGSHVFTFSSGGASLLNRARAYADKAAAASEGNRNDTAFRLAGHVAALADGSDRLSEPDIFEVVSTWNRRNEPPLPDAELWQCVKSALVNGTPRHAKENGEPKAAEPSKPCDKFTFGELLTSYPRLNPPVVDGLFREGETVNLVSTSKVGKSWLAYDLALSIIRGFAWLQRFDTERGRVLLIDNELHRGTLANRIPAVARELGIQPAEYADDLEVWPLRGNLRNLHQLGEDFAKITPGTYKAIILDAKYRFAIAGKSENDNAAETLVYNLLDQYAAHTEAAFVLVHHTSKGNQGEKRITDVGSGAGAQSRAADCHLVLREHEQPDVAVLDAAVRSFAPVEPLALKWEFPLWRPDISVDTAKLKGRLNRAEQQQCGRDKEGIDAIVDTLRKDGPGTGRELRRRTAISRERLERLLNILCSQQQVVVTSTTIRGNECDVYSLPTTRK